MKKIKSYLAFTSFIYRLGIFLVIPVLCIFMEYSIQKGLHVSGASVIAAVLVMIETVSDNWVFGGIQSKNSISLDYMKSSPVGDTLIKTGLRMDLLRRFFSITVILGICFMMSSVYMVEQTFSYIILSVANTILLACVLSVTGVLIARFFSALWSSMLTGYILFMVCIAGIILMQFAMLPVLVVLLILAVFISILSVKVAEKKVKESYYDK